MLVFPGNKSWFFLVRSSDQTLAPRLAPPVGALLRWTGARDASRRSATRVFTWKWLGSICDCLLGCLRNATASHFILYFIDCFPKKSMWDKVVQKTSWGLPVWFLCTSWGRRSFLSWLVWFAMDWNRWKCEARKKDEFLECNFNKKTQFSLWTQRRYKANTARESKPGIWFYTCIFLSACQTSGRSLYL